MPEIVCFLICFLFLIGSYSGSLYPWGEIKIKHYHPNNWNNIHLHYHKLLNKFVVCKNIILSDKFAGADGVLAHMSAHM